MVSVWFLDGDYRCRNHRCNQIMLIFSSIFHLWISIGLHVRIPLAHTHTLRACVMGWINLISLPCFQSSNFASLFHPVFLHTIGFFRILFNSSHIRMIYGIKTLLFVKLYLLYFMYLIAKSFWQLVNKYYLLREQIHSFRRKQLFEFSYSIHKHLKHTFLDA